MSSNAITLDGQLVNVDGLGNRVASLIQNYSGPDAKVVGIKFNGTEFSLATESVSNEETTTERYEFDTPSSSE